MSPNIANAFSVASCPPRSCGSSTSSTSTAPGEISSRVCSIAAARSADSRHRKCAAGLLSLRRRFAPGPLSPASPASVVGRGVGPDETGGAAGSSQPGRLSRTVLQRFRNRGTTLVAGTSHPAGPRRGRHARTRPGSGQSRTADASPAGAGRLATVHQRAARRSSAHAQDGRELAPDPGTALCDPSALAVRRAAHPRGQEGTEALPLGLERRARSRRCDSRTWWPGTC